MATQDRGTRTRGRVAIALESLQLALHVAKAHRAAGHRIRAEVGNISIVRHLAEGHPFAGPQQSGSAHAAAAGAAARLWRARGSARQHKRTGLSPTPGHDLERFFQGRLALAHALNGEPELTELVRDVADPDTQD
jgi:hypothetical protein